METLYRLKTVVKDYDWGSSDLIPDLCNLPKTGEPVAELWMGVHAGGMSTLETGETLKSFLNKAPKSFLSVKEDKKQIDFLFKVLSADKALSIQIHPATEQASFGFQDEDARGLPINDPKRTYKDKSHKAEMIYALTDFWALMGILPATQIAHNLVGIDVPFWKKWQEKFMLEPTSEMIKEFCYELHTYKDVAGLVQESLPFLTGKKGALAWVDILYAQYGDDIGIFSPLWMNVVNLQAGESLFLEPTHIHAYLKGLGIELMANSDNVIRASLTSKFKDVTEFMRVATFEPKIIEKLGFAWRGKSTQVFSPAGVDFSLERINFEGSLEAKLSCPYAGIGIALGDLELELEGSTLILKKGESVLISASKQELAIKAQNADASFFAATWQN